MVRTGLSRMANGTTLSRSLSSVTFTFHWVTSQTTVPLHMLMHATETADDPEYAVDTKLINRRGIYKDVYGSGRGREWSDYQLRPNFPIAMTVAPELFDETRALQALRLADQILRSPMGMKTLDPNDMQYRPYYDNSNDSQDKATAKGRNYHNVCKPVVMCKPC